MDDRVATAGAVTAVAEVDELRLGRPALLLVLAIAFACAVTAGCKGGWQWNRGEMPSDEGTPTVRPLPATPTAAGPSESVAPEQAAESAAGEASAESVAPLPEEPPAPPEAEAREPAEKPQPAEPEKPVAPAAAEVGGPKAGPVDTGRKIEEAREGTKLAEAVDVTLDEAAVDCRVVRAHVESAQQLINSGDTDQATQAVLAALRATAFVRAGLPAVQARQCLERAVEETKSGRDARAIDAIEAAANVSAEVTLRGTTAEFRRKGTQAGDLIRDGKSTEARDVLREMIRMISPAESEIVASRLSDNLVGALSALDRDAKTVALAELAEAQSKVLTLLRALEGEI